MYRTCAAASPPYGAGHGAHPKDSCAAAMLTEEARSCDRTADVLTALEHAGVDVATKPGAHALPHGTQRASASSWYWPAAHRRQPRFAAVQLSYGTMRWALPPQSQGMRLAAIHAWSNGGFPARS